MENNKALPAFERQKKIVRLLEQQQRVTISRLSEEFAISEATARRDLETLAESGRVQRIHGGAISLREAPPEAPVVHRTAIMSAEKQRIGQAAAALVKDGETIFLGSGTTVLEVAQALRGRQSLTVITNSLLVINTLAAEGGIDLIVLGGILRASELSFIGHIAEQALNEVRADRVIMGIHAIDIEAGMTNDYLPETMTDRAILKAGRQVIIVADHSKCGLVATAFVAPVAQIDLLITSQAAPIEFIQSLNERQVEVLLV